MADETPDSKDSKSPVKENEKGDGSKEDSKDGLKQKEDKVDSEDRKAGQGTKGGQNQMGQGQALDMQKSSWPGNGEQTLVNAATTLTVPPIESREQPGFRAQAVSLGPFISDILICIMIGILFSVIPLFAVEPYQRGFFCSDESIRYPYKKSTVPTFALYIILMALLILTITGTEVFRILKLTESTTYSLSGKNINRFIIRFLTYFAHGFFGLLANIAFTQTTKWTVGRLRPHFINVCLPNVTLSPCSDPYEYIWNYVCQGSSNEMIREARLSFFSGHSSFSMGTAVFCVIYMQARLPRRIYGITLLPVLQGLLIGIALLIGLSRIADNMHHWSDVLVGFLVGCAIGYYSAVIMGRVFERTDQSFKNEERRPLVDSGPQQPSDKAQDNATSIAYTYPIRNAGSATVAPTQASMHPTIHQQSTVLVTTEALGAK